MNIALTDDLPEEQNKILKLVKDYAAAKNGTFIKPLPMNEKRMEYLKFHQQSVFKGSFDFSK